MPGPGWLNGWLKINTKHVVFPKSAFVEKGGNQSNSQQSQKTTSTAQSSTMGSTPRDPELAAIKRFSNRRSRRRLQRTRSNSDLIRELAIEKHYDDHHLMDVPRVIGVSEDGNDSEHAPARGGKISQDSRPRRNTTGMREEGSLENVDSLGMVSTASSPPTIGDSRVCDHHENLYEAAFLHQFERRHAQDSLTPTRHDICRAAQADSQHRAFGGFLPHPFFQSEEPRDCQKCAELNAELIATLDDLEYMKTMALTSEAVADPVKQQTENFEKYSKQLHELTIRHKKQVEQLTRERSLWQHEMQLKLSKFSGLCKHLNEESAVRNVESASLREELASVKAERNVLAEEVLRLRAQAECYEKQKLEDEVTRAKLLDYEQRGLERSENEIRSRDQVIYELTSRLESTLDQLESERQQQRNRRQIIFPASS
ncbi:predicted protein [Phaeodactylum tricornutum CCAP 1055/1]|jgi:hypothetical protein|uniref:Uncharacterized protein n=2 Tax=Phaeodactylum tricornutum TaxID=2850 RepID=B7FY18_PHATC|nr:predicted protein [Phaeodactylum tricornutum CCAP 1055/1]EEC48647.1 predicted protein [Phaeodactylum tricornutum CCAP 1055/1]|eukprot:XP_002179661.1 predicted protein [Phaeodactylum tricornutum CCAP 1055/1]